MAHTDHNGPVVKLGYGVGLLSRSRKTSRVQIPPGPLMVWRMLERVSPRDTLGFAGEFSGCLLQGQTSIFGLGFQLVSGLPAQFLDDRWRQGDLPLLIGLVATLAVHHPLQFHGPAWCQPPYHVLGIDRLIRYRRHV